MAAFRASPISSAPSNNSSRHGTKVRDLSCAPPPSTRSAQSSRVAGRPSRRSFQNALRRQRANVSESARRICPVNCDTLHWQMTVVSRNAFHTTCGKSWPAWRSLDRWRSSRIGRAQLRWGPQISLPRSSPPVRSMDLTLRSGQEGRLCWTAKSAPMGTPPRRLVTDARR